MASDLFKVHHSGDENSTAYRLYYEFEGKMISPFHDIPLVVDKAKGIFNMVVEIPKGTNAKMEIAPGEFLNPIKQDIKKEKLRFIDDIHPWKGYVWNYGAFPQTWEDPTHLNAETKAYGDKDPLDVCEIGTRTAHRGDIIQVKVLGVIGLIDEGETDWKVVAIDVNDPLAEKLNDIDDVKKHMPGYTFVLYEWLRTYKMPQGKPANEFAFNGDCKNRAYALEVIEENHQFWKRAVSGTIPLKHEKYELNCDNATLEFSPYKKDSLHVDFKTHVKGHTAERAASTTESVKEYVEENQRLYPHGNSNLSTIIDDIVSNYPSEDIKDKESYYTVKTASNEHGRWYGIYQTPHPVSVTSSNRVGDLEIVAAVFISHDALTLAYSGGPSLLFFKRENPTASFALTSPVKLPPGGQGDLFAPATFLATKL